jgi:hypothetical protein
MAERSKANIYGRSLAGIADLNPARGMDVCLLWVLCVFQVDVSFAGRFLVQRSPADCGVSMCVIYKPQELGGPGPRWPVAPEKKSCQFVLEITRS